MPKLFKRIIPGALVCTLTAGCANMSTGEQVGVAALGCGVLGAIVGVTTNSAGIGAAVGGGCFAIGGAAIAINYYQATKTRSVSQDEQSYGYSLTDINEPLVKIRSGTATPYQVKQGQKLAINTNYSVMTPADQASKQMSVEESLVLLQGAEELKTFGPHMQQRTAGGWNAPADFTIPDEMPPGNYTLEHRVKLGNSYSVEKSQFTVAAI